MCAIDSEGVKPSMSVQGPVDGKAFEGYVEHFLATTLKRGQIVVMDNLSAHKSKRVEAIIEEVGATLMFLPSYSPDYNPIEQSFSKVKNLIRRAKARTLEALFEATHHALSAVSAKDASGYFEHSGYKTLQDHSL